MYISVLFVLLKKLIKMIIILQTEEFLAIACTIKILFCYIIVCIVKTFGGNNNLRLKNNCYIFV